MGWFTKLFPPKARLAELFNSYHTAFVSATTTTDDYVDVEVKVRVRLYGNDAMKQDRYKNEEIAQGASGWGRVQWSCVSSAPPQIFGDLRQYKGQLVVNHLALGHELCHVLKLVADKMLDPDKYANINP